MKQVIQNSKDGELSLVEVPAPQIKAGGVLVKTRNSAVSVGTEKLIVNLAQQSLMGKALSRPDLVKKVIDKLKTEGLRETFQAVAGQMDKLQPLGYSSAGEVLAVGEGVSEFKVGDRVACGSDLCATHSEATFVPKNNCVKIPEGVDYDEAAFAYIAAIAMHALRCAEITFGCKVAVVGLGLLGQLAVQMLRAWGCEAFGYDLDERKTKLAVELGAKDSASDRREAVAKGKLMTKGAGFDATIIMASTASNDPLNLSAEITRERGRIVACGLVRLDVPRNVFFDKELSLIVSRASGPGKFDPNWEFKGIDYPSSLVRWTQSANMSEYLEMVKRKNINMKKIITHRFKIDDAMRAYEMFLGSKPHYYLGVVLDYENQPALEKKIRVNEKRSSPAGEPVVGMIGAGNFANATILPCLKKIPNIQLRGVATATGISGSNAAKQYGFEYCTTDYKEILKDADINTVIIATRHDLHAQIIVEALEAGKNVFAEKPLATSKAEVNAISKAYDKCDRLLMVGFNRRYSPFAIKAKELIGASGIITINCRVNAEYAPKDHWVLNKEGGGRIIGEVCHFIDLIQYLTSSVPVRVCAETISAVDKRLTNEDNVASTIKMENGSLASLLYTAIGHKALPRERIEVFGDNQSCVIDNFTNLAFFREGKRVNMRRFNIDRGHQNEFEIFFRSIKKGGALPADYASYVYTTLATFAIRESIKSGKPVDIIWDK